MQCDVTDKPTYLFNKKIALTEKHILYEDCISTSCSFFKLVNSFRMHVS